MFKLTIETDNPAILAAIANAVKNTPPAGWTEASGPPEVNVHASLKSMKAAKEAVNVTDGATVKEEVIPEEKAKPDKKATTPKSEPVQPPVDPKDAEERRVILRGLVVRVSKETDKTLKEATEIAANASGVGSPAHLTNCSVEAFEKARAALEALLS